MRRAWSIVGLALALGGREPIGDEDCLAPDLVDVPADDDSLGFSADAVVTYLSSMPAATLTPGHAAVRRR